MIALNETNEYAAEVAFTLFDGLTPLTGHAFTLGEVQIKLPGAGWVNASVAKIVEKGYGRYCVRLTSSQTAVAGDVYIRAVVTGSQSYFGSDVIGELGGDIPQGGTGSVNFYLPDATDPYNNPALTGDPTSVMTLGDVRVCLPDASYVDVALSDITEIGYGLYRVNLDASDTAKKGKVFVYASVSGYQPFEGYCTILGLGTAVDEEDPPTPIPVPVTALSPVSSYRDLITGAINRLCEYTKSGDFEAGTFVDNVGLDMGFEEGMG